MEIANSPHTKIKAQIDKVFLPLPVAKSTIANTVEVKPETIYIKGEIPGDGSSNIPDMPVNIKKIKEIMPKTNDATPSGVFGLIGSLFFEKFIILLPSFQIKC